MENELIIELVVTPSTNEVTFNYSGYHEQNLKTSDISLFNVYSHRLKEAVNKVLGIRTVEDYVNDVHNNPRMRRDNGSVPDPSFMLASVFAASLLSFTISYPSDIHLKRPATWNNEDVFDKCDAKPVTRVTSVKSVELKSYVKKPVAVSTQTFRNNLGNPIKVNTGLSHKVKNTFKTTWYNESRLHAEQVFEYGVKVSFVNILHGKTTVDYSTKWGTSEEKTDSVTIGTNIGTEVELAPGQAITAVLTAHVVEIEAEITYVTSLRNRLVAIYDKKHEDKNLWSIDIRDVMNRGGISNEISFKETIKLNYFIEGSLEVNETPRT